MLKTARETRTVFLFLFNSFFYLRSHPLDVYIYAFGVRAGILHAPARALLHTLARVVMEGLTDFC